MHIKENRGAELEGTPLKTTSEAFPSFIGSYVSKKTLYSGKKKKAKQMRREGGPARLAKSSRNLVCVPTLQKNHFQG